MEPAVRVRNVPWVLGLLWSGWTRACLVEENSRVYLALRVSSGTLLDWKGMYDRDEGARVSPSQSNESTRMLTSKAR